MEVKQLIEDYILSRDQMLNLFNLGLKLDKYSMFWFALIKDYNGNLRNDPTWHIGYNTDFRMQSEEDPNTPFNSIPTLSLEEILNILPDEIDDSLYFSLGKNKIVYISRYGSGGNDYTFEGKSLLDAAYNTLIWMLEYEKI